MKLWHKTIAHSVFPSLQDSIAVPKKLTVRKGNEVIAMWLIHQLHYALTHRKGVKSLPMKLLSIPFYIWCMHHTLEPILCSIVIQLLSFFQLFLGESFFDRYGSS